MTLDILEICPSLTSRVCRQHTQPFHSHSVFCQRTEPTGHAKKSGTCSTLCIRRSVLRAYWSTRIQGRCSVMRIMPNALSLCSLGLIASERAERRLRRYTARPLRSIVMKEGVAVGSEMAPPRAPDVADERTTCVCNFSGTAPDPLLLAGSARSHAPRYLQRAARCSASRGNLHTHMSSNSVFLPIVPI